jgi:hypothetical protein
MSNSTSLLLPGKKLEPGHFTSQLLTEQKMAYFLFHLIGILVLPLPFRIKLSKKENNMSP